MQMRDYQQECIDLIDSIHGGNHLVQMATGLGKTVTFANIPRKGRVLLLSHRDELVHQPIKYYDCPVGVEKAGERSDGEEVVSASVQTLSRGDRLEKTFRPGEFDMIITDEAHHALAPSYGKIYAYLKPRLHVGFTATPKRGDDRGLDGVFEDIIFERDLRWGIENGYLTDIDCRRVEVGWSTASLKTRYGDFTPADLARMVDQPSTNEQIAAAYNEFAIGQTIIFASSVAHAHALADLIPGARVVDGKTPADERRAIVEDFTARKFPCIVNCGVFTEGTDMPLIETVLLARPTKSPALYAQMVGRGLRRYTFPDGREKPFLRLIDCKGVTDAHNLCTAPTLFGLNEEDFPKSSGHLVDGLLTELEDRIEEAEDTPNGWVLRARRVDVLEGDIAWISFADGWRRVKGKEWAVEMAPADLLGNVVVKFTQHGKVQEVTYPDQAGADAAALYWLSTYDPMRSDSLFWSSESVKDWASKPATEKQVEYIASLLGSREMPDGPLSRRDAQILIENLKERNSCDCAAKYGRCPICGKPMKPSSSGKTLVCSSNRWSGSGSYMKISAGCGLVIPVSLDGIKVTAVDLADLAGEDRRIERPGGYWVYEAKPNGSIGLRRA